MRAFRSDLTMLRVAVLVALALCGPRPSAAADALPPPTGEVILTIAGAVTLPNVGDEAHLDRALLEAIGMVAVTTANPWVEGEVRYEGPLVRDVLAAVGADGATIAATALNDYSADIPIEDFRTIDVILALKADGDYMAIRDKGPIFIVYPFSAASDLESETYYARSVWQLRRLDVR